MRHIFRKSNQVLPANSRTQTLVICMFEIASSDLLARGSRATGTFGCSPWNCRCPCSLLSKAPSRYEHGQWSTAKSYVMLGFHCICRVSLIYLHDRSSLASLLRGNPALGGARLLGSSPAQSIKFYSFRAVDLVVPAQFSPLHIRESFANDNERHSTCFLYPFGNVHAAHGNPLVLVFNEEENHFFRASPRDRALSWAFHFTFG